MIIEKYKLKYKLKYNYINFTKIIKLVLFKFVKSLCDYTTVTCTKKLLKVNFPGYFRCLYIKDTTSC